ncbi:hypothetical protein INR49_012414 [Caranx melampygus]|nr:hypothetical protein INR49_012414 [Caranx melampygus]
MAAEESSTEPAFDQTTLFLLALLGSKNYPQGQQINNQNKPCRLSPAGFVFLPCRRILTSR